MIAIFARPDHPTGYGMSGNTAHGYSILIVECKDKDEVQKVTHKISRVAINIPPERIDGWYGEIFDLIAILDCNISAELLQSDIQTIFPIGMCRSLGDNRSVAFYSAEYILNFQCQHDDIHFESHL